LSREESGGSREATPPPEGRSGERGRVFGGTPAGPRPKRGRLRAVLLHVKRWASDRERQRSWAISLATAGWFVAVMYYWSGGALLYRVDFPGVYRLGGFLLYPSANYIIPSLAAGVTLGNVYAAQYVSLFTDTFLCTLGAQIFARELFRRTFSGTPLTLLQVLAATFYIVNPYNVTWTYYALTLNMFLNNAAFFLVMALMVRMVRALRSRTPFTWVDAIWLGVALGLSSPTSFPNLARTLLIEGIGFLVLALYALGLYLAQRSDRLVTWNVTVRFSSVTVPLAAAMVAYPFWVFLTSWLLQPAAIAQVAARNGPVTLANSYHPLSDVVRLLARTQITHQAYYQLFLSNPWVITSSWMWPVLAIAVPLIFSFSRRIPDRAWIWVCLLLMVPCLIWATGYAPPFGALNAPIIAAVPYGIRFMPLFFPIELIVVKLYVVLAAFSVVMIYLVVRGHFPLRTRPRLPPTPRVSPRVRGRRISRSRVRQGLAMGGAVGLAILLSLTATPIFVGSIYEVGKGGRGTFFIPEGYFQVRHELTREHANALVLPSMHLYVKTSWGYGGATGFYDEFFYPSRMVTPAYYGPYEYLLNSTRLQYAQATDVIVPGTNETPIMLTRTSHWIQPNSSRGFYSLPFRPALNLTGDEWLVISFPTTNPALLSELIEEDHVRVGLKTGTQGPGWYIPNDGGQALLRSVNSTAVEIALLLGAPMLGSYNLSEIDKMFLVLHSPDYFPLLALGTPELWAVRNSSVAPGWMDLVVGNYRVSYILVDLTLGYGRAEPLAYARMAVLALEQDHLVTEVYSSPDLQLWKLI
jgi:hypothetical protein